MSTQTGREFARDNGMMFMECRSGGAVRLSFPAPFDAAFMNCCRAFPSALNKVGVQLAFEELTQKIFDTPDLLHAGGSAPGGLRLGQTAENTGSGAEGPCSC